MAILEWNYEENSHRSFDVPHVHVFLRVASSIDLASRTTSNESSDECSVVSVEESTATGPLQSAQVSSAEQATNPKRPFPSSLVSDSSDEEYDQRAGSPERSPCLSRSLKRKRVVSSKTDSPASPEESIHPESPCATFCSCANPSSVRQSSDLSDSANINAAVALVHSGLAQAARASER